MGINKWELSNRHPTRWLFLSTISHWNWNLECWFLLREETLRVWRKTLGVEMRTNNNLNPHVLPCFGNETQATVVEGKCSHHCAIPVPLRPISFLSSSLCILSISYKVLSVVLEETENWIGLLYKWWFAFNQLMLLSTINRQISWDWAEHVKFG